METILQRLTDLDEISGALLIGKDGLIVSGALQNEDEEMLGAMSAAVFGSIANFTTQVNNGDILHVILETQNGIIQLAERQVRKKKSETRVAAGDAGAPARRTVLVWRWRPPPQLTSDCLHNLQRFVGKSAAGERLPTCRGTRREYFRHRSALITN